jgi:hypothetical protein
MGSLGQPVDPALVYFRTVPSFETSAPELRWLTRAIFIGVGQRNPSDVLLLARRVTAPQKRSYNCLGRQ